MGFLDTLRRRFAAAPLASGTPALPAPKAFVEKGVTGTSNWSGDIQAEENPSLKGTLAYGMPTSSQWGEWERIARTDPAIAMALEFVTAPVRDATVDVEPAPEEAMPDRVLAQQQADFVRWCLLEKCEPGWPEFAQQVVRTKLTFGFALHETVLAPVQHVSLPGGRGIGLVKLGERMPSSIHTNGWLEDDAGNLVAVKQWGLSGRLASMREVTLPVDCLLLHTWNRNGNNYRGFSALRAVWYLAKVREALIKLVAVSSTREGAGLPVATSDSDKPEDVLDPAQRKALQRLLANNVFHEAASVVMPKGWKLEWVYSPGANKGHVVDVYNALGAAILQQLAAQQMVLGVNGEGNRSVGETHYRASEAFVQGIVANLEGTLNGIGERPYTGLARRLVLENWGPQNAYPRIRVTVKRSQMPATERVAAAVQAKSAGLLTPTLEVENAVRESLGFSPLDEAARDAELAKRPPVAPPAPGLPPQQQPQVQASAQSGFTPSRPLRESEKVLRLAEYSAALDVAKVDFEKRIKPLVAELLVKAQSAVAEAMRDGDPSEVATLPLDTVRLEEEVTAYLDGLRVTGYRQVVRELKDSKAPEALAEKRSEGQPGVVVKAAAEEDDKYGDTVEEETTDLIDAQGRALVRRVTTRLRSELEAEALDAVRTGADIGEVVSRVLQRQLDTAAFRTDAGAVITRVWNLGRDEAARVVGGVSEVELSAVLDGNQCGVCNLKDGQRFAFNSAEHDANTPPLRDCDGGPRCRCLLLYLPDRGDE